MDFIPDSQKVRTRDRAIVVALRIWLFAVAMLLFSHSLGPPHLDGARGARERRVLRRLLAQMHKP